MRNFVCLVVVVSLLLPGCRPADEQPEPQGTLEVWSEPLGASIHRGEERLGTTPWRARLAPGEFDLTLKLDGHEDAHLRVEVVPGEIKRVEQRLTALPLPREPGLELARPMGLPPGFAGVGGIRTAYGLRFSSPPPERLWIVHPLYEPWSASFDELLCREGNDRPHLDFGPALAARPPVPRTLALGSSMGPFPLPMDYSPSFYVFWAGSSAVALRSGDSLVFLDLEAGLAGTLPVREPMRTAFSHDSAWLAAEDRGYLALTRTASGQTRRWPLLADPEAGQAGLDFLAWSPCGGYLLGGLCPLPDDAPLVTPLWLLDLTTGGLSDLGGTPGVAYSLASWSGDEVHLWESARTCGARPKQVRVSLPAGPVVPAEPGPVAPHPLARDPARGITAEQAWWEDPFFAGELSWDEGGETRVADLSSFLGARDIGRDTHPQLWIYPEYSPDGHHVFFTARTTANLAEPGQPWLAGVVERAGGEPTAFPGDPSTVHDPACSRVTGDPWHPERGRLVLLGQGDVWRLALAHPARLTLDFLVDAPDFILFGLRDGERLFFVEPGGAGVLDLGSRRVDWLARPPQGESYRSAALCPGGRRLLLLRVEADPRGFAWVAVDVAELP